MKILIVIYIGMIQAIHAETIQGTEIKITHPDVVIAGRDFAISFLIQNNGWEDKEQIVLIFNPNDAIKPSKNITIDKLAQGGSFGETVDFKILPHASAGEHFINLDYSQVLLEHNETPRDPVHTNIAIVLNVKEQPQVSIHTITPESIFAQAEFLFTVEILSQDIDFKDVRIEIIPPDDIEFRGQTLHTLSFIQKNELLSITSRVMTPPDLVQTEYKLPFQILVSYTNDIDVQTEHSQIISLVLRPRNFMELTTDGGIWIGGFFIAPYISLCTIIPTGAILSLIKRRKILKLLLIFLLGITFTAASSHGVGYELLPPLQLGDKIVSLEVSSSKYDELDRQVQFSLFDTNNNVTVRDVTYDITATKGDLFLFDESFDASDGTLIFVLKGDDSDEITLGKKTPDNFIEFIRNFFASVLGLNEDITQISGSPFNTGGLYKFDVEITTEPNSIVYDVGLSIPDKTTFEIQDLNFGTQLITFITYYDLITDFDYNPSTRGISFSMPFEWSESNINETSVVHEEFEFQKTFGDLLVSKYVANVNGLTVPDNVITIDAFPEESQLVHIVLNQNELRNIYNKTQGNGMNFLITPAEDVVISTVTRNGQFRISLDWEPKNIQSNSDTTFYFNITDIFLKDRPVAVPYELSLVHDGDVIYNTSGVSSDVKGEQNEFTVSIPVSGIVTLQFENLMDSSFARANIPIIVDRTTHMAN